MQPEREAELLTEIARLYASLIRVVREIDDPQLKAEISELIWPRRTPTESPMTEPIVVAPVTVVTVKTWLLDALERGIVTFLVGILTMAGVDQFSDFSTDWGKKLATAGLLAFAAVATRAIWPKSGFGLPPTLDILARATLSGVQAGAAVILANVKLDWFAVSNWQLAGAAALAAAISAVKGAIAVRVVTNTVTPASLAKTSP